MTVRDVVKRDVGDAIEVSAVVSKGDPLPSFRLWYRFHSWFGDGSVAEGDPFLAALLPLAIHARKPLHIHSVVSEELLRGVNDIMRIWHSWNRRDTPVPVSSDGVKRSEHGGVETGSFFSLGVDSFYTLLRNLREEHGERRISRLLLVHGFDIPLSEESFFRRIADRARKVADSMGVRLMTVSTNFRALDPFYAVGGRFSSEWGRSTHGAALASVGLILQGLLKHVLIPASHTYADPIAWGSHPQVDPLWSTESTRFIHDGAETTRVRKTLYLADHRVALDNLRVCAIKDFMTVQNEAAGDLLNCGTCEKCVRTMLPLWIVGALDRCGTFAAPFDRNRVLGLGDGGREYRMFHARKRGVSGEDRT